jgi:hypothetical protein
MERIDWSFQDPAATAEDEQTRLAVFRKGGMKYETD